MQKIVFPLFDDGFYRRISVSKLTRGILLKADKSGMRPVFGFARAGCVHRVAHLLKDKDYTVTEGEHPQQMFPLCVSITDRKSLSRLPASVLNREHLLEKLDTYYEGNMVSSTWAGAIAAAGNLTFICPREMTFECAVDAGLVRVCAQSGQLQSLPIKAFAPFAFSVSRQVEAFANDKDLRGHPNEVERWRDAFTWLSAIFAEASRRIEA